MSGAAIRAGSAFVEILTQDKTQAGFAAVSKRLKSFAGGVARIGASLTAISAAGLGGFAAASQKFAAFGDQVDKLGKRTGLSTDFVQSLLHSAELAGTTIEDVEVAVRTMQRTLARTGELQGLTPDEQFLHTADRISKIEDPTQRAAEAMLIFGRAGAQILPAIMDGASALTDQLELMRANGAILSPEDVAMAAVLTDAWANLKQSLANAVRIIGSSVAPAMIWLLDSTTAVVQVIGKVIAGNKGLFTALAGGLVVLGAVGGFLLAIAGGLTALGAMLTFIGPGIAAVSAAFAFLISPIGLTIAAVVGLLALLPVLAYMIDRDFLGGAGLQFLSDAFGRLWAIAKQTIGGIMTALMNGDWQRAGAIAGAGLYVAMVTAWGWIKIGFHDLGTWLIKFLTDLFGSQAVGIILQGIKGIVDVVNAGLEALGRNTIDTGGLDELINASGDDATFKRKLDERSRRYRAAVEGDIGAAQALLDALTKEEDAAADKQKQQIKQQTGGAGLGPLSAHLEQGAAVGALVASAAVKVNQQAPQFEAIADKIEETNNLLGDIKTNTADLGEEFAD